MLSAKICNHMNIFNCKAAVDSIYRPAALNKPPHSDHIQTIFIQKNFKNVKNIFFSAKKQYQFLTSEFELTSILAHSHYD